MRASGSCFRRDVAQCFQGEIFVAIFFLNGFQDAEQSARPSPAIEDYFINENLFFRGKAGKRECLHRHSSERATSSYRNVAFNSNTRRHWKHIRE